jgi:hypothetical protein
MGTTWKKTKSSISKKEEDTTQQALLDTQELAAMLFEQNLALNAALLDTQELVAELFEGGAASGGN